MAPRNIPLGYRAFFLYCEPFMAFMGTVTVHFSPARFLNTMSSTAQYAPDNKVVYDQLAATYLLLAFNDAVVLRVTNDVRVWRAMMVGMFICDLFHLYASWLALGSSIFWDPRSWRSEDWVNLVSLLGGAAIRLAFLAGVGLQLNADVEKHD